VLTVGCCQLTGSLLNLILYLLNTEVVMDDLVDSLIKVIISKNVSVLDLG
jgi:hypothetical protein